MALPYFFGYLAPSFLPISLAIQKLEIFLNVSMTPVDEW